MNRQLGRVSQKNEFISIFAGKTIYRYHLLIYFDINYQSKLYKYNIYFFYNITMKSKITTKKWTNVEICSIKVSQFK